MSRPPNHQTVFADDYKVIRRLDAGGMGRVYLADQLSTGRSRALKVMHARLVEDPELRKRFAQEARIGGQIHSEHVVEVVGAGVDARTGLPWLAMEHLDGENLSRYVEHRGHLPAAEVLQLLRQVCHALGAAHRVGIVHRDIKPENVYLARARRADAAYTVKVLDFGLAKALQSATHVGTVAVGSPRFMAPEQFEGATVSPQTDVWALGLLAFYLLTGRNYQLSARSNRVDVHRLAREARRASETRASTRARELATGVELSDGFDWWFASCVGRRPVERFADAGVAFEQLARALSPPASWPTQLHSPPAGSPYSKSMRDALTLVGLATLAVVVTLVAVALAVVLAALI